MDAECTALIDGRWLALDRATSFASTDPATGEALGRVHDCALGDVEAAIDAAGRAFRGTSWAHDPRLRQGVLLAWADRLAASADDLARLLTLENGKPLLHSRGEIGGAISQIRYYAGLARHIPGHVLEVAPGEFATVLREPAGVAGIITPWNAPVALLVRSLAPALAAGCTAVVKCAPQTALTMAAVMRPLAEIAGLPAGAVNLFTERGSAGAQALVSADGVDVLSFTGSTEVGQKIMAAAAPSMKKLSLELGGKAACLVFPDVDMAAAAGEIAGAGTILAGQQCTAARRVLVHESCFEEMRDALAKALSGIRLGHGLEPQSQMGPLIDHAARDQVHASVQKALALCDEVILPGGIPDDGALKAGSFLAPSLVAHGDRKAFFCQEEIFGPFMVMERFSSEEEAVEMANDTVFGLAGSVWTCDGARALRLARALRNGTVWLNSHGKFSAEAETGGYRRSGLGRLQGYDALSDFTELKHVFQAVGSLLT